MGVGKSENARPLLSGSTTHGISASSASGMTYSWRLPQFQKLSVATLEASRSAKWDPPDRSAAGITVAHRRSPANCARTPGFVPLNIVETYSRGSVLGRLRRLHSWPSSAPRKTGTACCGFKGPGRQPCDVARSFGADLGRTGRVSLVCPQGAFAQRAFSPKRTGGLRPLSPLGTLASNELRIRSAFGE